MPLVLSRTLLEKRITQSETSLRHFLRHPVLIMLTQDYARTAGPRGCAISCAASCATCRNWTRWPPRWTYTRRRCAGACPAEGTTFKDIKNQVRRDTALHFLGKQGLSIEEIAHRAGFSESSAFIRAFKGWTGVTPYTYRKGL